MTVPAGQRRHTVTLQNPGPAVADADGGFTQTFSDLSPRSWQVEIKPATARDLERVTAGTAMASATHIVTGPYRADVTTKTRILFNGRLFFVVGVSNPKERGIETIALCNEIVE
jgi:SPP1 family predicted phage head-tail adaptor